MSGILISSKVFRGRGGLGLSHGPLPVKPVGEKALDEKKDEPGDHERPP
jgi:hypothetical protein